MKILIIYGTTGGNTEMAAEQVADVLRKNGHTVELKRVEKSTPQDATSADLCILACPTYGHGVLQEHFVPFHAALKQADLKGKKYAVIGLGDPKYDAQYHVESATIIEEAIKGAGGELVCPALKISRSPVPFLDTLIQKWAEGLSKLL
ncbi:flavodoxin family protein [Candidatus Peregrinibacteria bacterium]|nr:flavodoxin family protein [Candidatus Peregrinibacteria bacterium]